MIVILVLISGKAFTMFFSIFFIYSKFLLSLSGTKEQILLEVVFNDLSTFHMQKSPPNEVTLSGIENRQLTFL